MSKPTSRSVDLFRSEGLGATPDDFYSAAALDEICRVGSTGATKTPDIPHLGRRINTCARVWIIWSAEERRPTQNSLTKRMASVAKAAEQLLGKLGVAPGLDVSGPWDHLYQHVPQAIWDALEGRAKAELSAGRGSLLESLPGYPVDECSGTDGIVGEAIAGVFRLHCWALQFEKSVDGDEAADEGRDDDSGLNTFILNVIKVWRDEFGHVLTFERRPGNEKKDLIQFVDACITPMAATHRNQLLFPIEGSTGLANRVERALDAIEAEISNQT